MQAYSDPKRASDPHALPDVEIFHNNMKQGLEMGLEPGWYWQACFPGCLPDGDPNGPFNTYELALADAQADSD